MVHFLLAPLPEGAAVEIEVDWKRRFDHMQQHSGSVLSMMSFSVYNLNGDNL